jgi:hypothetical protein
MDPLTTLWFATQLQRVENEQREWLEAVLGTMWTQEDFVKRSGGGRRPSTVRVPVTVALAQSDFLKEVRRMLGAPQADMPGGAPEELQNTEIVELGDMPKEDFLAVIGSAGVLPTHMRREQGGQRKPPKKR